MLKIRTTTCEWMRRVSLFLSIFAFMFFWISFADFSDARSGLKWRDISGAGWALWIFIILGAIIILLQLIPAVLMFFSFIGSGTHSLYEVMGKEVKAEKPAEEKETV